MVTQNNRLFFFLGVFLTFLPWQSGAFCPVGIERRAKSGRIHNHANLRESSNANAEGRPQFPTSASSSSGMGYPQPGMTQTSNSNAGNDDEEKQKANRFSKFAPSAELDDEDFRKQLKENMKADLERRRRADPRRGNQPAKSYLDSL